jgi:hypothetical protein
MAEIVEPPTSKPGVFDCRQKVPFHKVIWIQNVAFRRWEHEIIES